MGGRGTTDQMEEGREGNKHQIFSGTVHVSFLLNIPFKQSSWHIPSPANCEEDKDEQDKNDDACNPISRDPLLAAAGDQLVYIYPIY